MIALCLSDLHDCLEVPDQWMIALCLSDLHGGVVPDAACCRIYFWSNPVVAFAGIVVDDDAIVPWHRDTRGRGVRFRQVLRQVEFLYAHAA